MNLNILHEAGRVGSAIDKAVADRFKSQKEAAKAIKIANSTLSRYKRIGLTKGTRAPDLRTLAKLKKILGNKAYQAILSAINTEVNPPKHKKHTKQK